MKDTYNLYVLFIYLFILVFSYSIIVLDRPLGLQEVEACWIFRELAHEGGKVASLTHQSHLFPNGDPWYSFLLGAESHTGP
jgi:hypothetical protein